MRADLAAMRRCGPTLSATQAVRPSGLSGSCWPRSVGKVMALLLVVSMLIVCYAISVCGSPAPRRNEGPMAKTYQVNAFARFGNTVTAAMIRLGIAPAGMYLLTVRGRKSGLPRTVPVNLIQHQGHRWLVAPYGEVAWVRNARAAGEVELRRGSTAERAQVREVSAGEAAPVLRSYLRRARLVVGP